MMLGGLSSGFSLTMPIVILGAISIGVVALGHAQRSAASARAELQVTREVSKHNSQVRTGLDEVSHELEAKVETYETTDRLLRVEIDSLKEQIRANAPEDDEDRLECPSHCIVSWPSDSSP